MKKIPSDEFAADSSELFGEITKTLKRVDDGIVKVEEYTGRLIDNLIKGGVILPGTLFLAIQDIEIFVFVPEKARFFIRKIQISTNDVLMFVGLEKFKPRNSTTVITYKWLIQEKTCLLSLESVLQFTVLQTNAKI